MNHIVFGGTGLLGSAIARSVDNPIIVSSKDFDATNQQQTFEWFENHKHIVAMSHAYICTGRVAGIVGQDNEFMLRDNTLIAINLLSALSQYQKIGLTFYYSSSCVYPRAMDEFSENDLMHGVCEPSNEGYAIGKIVGQKYCSFLNASHGYRKFITIVPPNLYGENDNWDLATCHVLPALTQKIYLAHQHRDAQLTLMGVPTVHREFIRSDDVASVTQHILHTPSEYDTINVGLGIDLSLSEIVNQLADRIGYTGRILFSGKNKGKLRKLMKVDRQNELGWKPTYDYNDMFNFLVEEVEKRYGKT